MNIYLWKRYNDEKSIVLHTNLDSAKKEGYTTKPELTVSETEWYENNSTAYVNDDGNIVLGYSDEQKKEMKASEMRRLRDEALEKSDLYMIPDYPISDEYREKIKEYRQTLRDLPESEEWPYVELPEFPTE